MKGFLYGLGVAHLDRAASGLTPSSATSRTPNTKAETGDPESSGRYPAARGVKPSRLTCRPVDLFRTRQLTSQAFERQPSCPVPWKSRALYGPGGIVQKPRHPSLNPSPQQVSWPMCHLPERHPGNRFTLRLPQRWFPRCRPQQNRLQQDCGEGGTGARRSKHPRPLKPRPSA